MKKGNGMGEVLFPAAVDIPRYSSGVVRGSVHATVLLVSTIYFRNPHPTIPLSLKQPSRLFTAFNVLLLIPRSIYENFLEISKIWEEEVEKTHTNNDSSIFPIPSPFLHIFKLERGIVIYALCPFPTQSLDQCFVAKYEDEEEMPI